MGSGFDSEMGVGSGCDSEMGMGMCFDSEMGMCRAFDSEMAVARDIQHCPVISTRSAAPIPGFHTDRCIS